MYPTGLVATSAYDGVVKVWNIESGHVNCKLTADNYGLETTRSLIPADVKRQVSYGNAGMDITEKISRLGKHWGRTFYENNSNSCEYISVRQFFLLMQRLY